MKQAKLPQIKVKAATAEATWLAQAVIVLNLRDLYNDAQARLAQAKAAGKHSIVAYWINELLAIREEFKASAKVENILRAWMNAA